MAWRKSMTGLRSVARATAASAPGPSARSRPSPRPAPAWSKFIGILVLAAGFSTPAGLGRAAMAATTGGCVVTRLDPATGLPVCFTVVRVEEDPEARRPEERSEPPPRKYIQGIPVDLGRCEFISDVSGTVEVAPDCAVPPTPQEYVALVIRWALAAAPRPALRVAPGWALAGKEGFLEISGPSVFSGGGTTLPVTWNCAVTTSTVDWGDGHQRRAPRRDARPWPDGRVIHVYTEAGRYKVVLHEAWGCLFETPTGSVPLTLNTQTSPYALRVDQVQAVGRR